MATEGEREARNQARVIKQQIEDLDRLLRTGNLTPEQEKKTQATIDDLRERLKTGQRPANAGNRPMPGPL